jgi:hypothetical protein
MARPCRDRRGHPPRRLSDASLARDERYGAMPEAVLTNTQGGALRRACGYLRAGSDTSSPAGGWTEADWSDSRVKRLEAANILMRQVGG